MRSSRTPSRVISKRKDQHQTHQRVSLITRLHLNEARDWSRVSNYAILKQFRLAYEQAPSYRLFLRQQGVDAKSIQTPKDIPGIPIVTKANYLRAYSWDTLSRSGSLTSESLVLTATSGSTGQPFYIPRSDSLHEDAMVFHRLFLERSGLDPKKPTLVIVAFGMGVWIGGVLTYEAFRRISSNGWPLSILTPGVNKKEIFESLIHIGSAYKQLVLCGYPPFVKDLVDDASTHGVHWKRWDMRVVCAAEAFSEHFRDYLMKKTGMTDPYRGVMNIYGSAELGTMATETPLSILIRRLALSNKELYLRLFNDAHRFPTVAQFIPGHTTFEQGDRGEILVTGGSPLPFVRYDIGDQGGVFSFDEALEKGKEAGIDLLKEAKQAGIADTIMRLPFVYLYERSDLSTKLYGAIIYPEHVKIGLQDKTLEKYITGRFTMTTENDAQHNEYLEINLELKAGIKSGSHISARAVEMVTQSLSNSSDEYRYLARSIREKVVPKVVLWPHEHPTYFRPGIKQKWVIR